MSKFFAIVQMTFFEVIRQPSGLMVALLLSFLMLCAPSFSTFAMGRGSEMLRTNLLSSLMMGGVIYVSFMSMSLFYKEMNQKTILSILSKPVSISIYYLGKKAGLLLVLICYFVMTCSVAWMSMITGTPETASTVINFLPMILFISSLIFITLLATLLNYLLNVHIIGFIFIAWFCISPILLIAIYILSPVFELPVPETGIVISFLKAALLILFVMIVVNSFSIAMSSFTGPVLNLALCILFLILGLMSPGLKSAALQILKFDLINYLPNFHLFWMADMIRLERIIPVSYLAYSGVYALALMFAFTGIGIFALLRRDYR